MANVLLGVTGSVAAIYTPQLFDRLKQAGHRVKVVATQAAQYFFDATAIDPLPGPPARRNPEFLILDEDEWPGRTEGNRYQRADRVVHIELRRWAELLVIAPLDANTLAKLANGLADNCLTCVWRAWDRSRPVILAPAMNTLMWEHPLTARHLRQLAEEEKDVSVPGSLTLEALLWWINGHCSKLAIVPPQTKRLACDDVGMGAMASLDDIVALINEILKPRGESAS
jgi:phosphopantothenoylcysteine decarboxylase